MQRKPTPLGNKFMAGCALVVACALATPVAMAHGRHSNNTADVVGALVVGAVIGGVLASTSQHNDNYYQGGNYYPPQPYASAGYNNYYNGYPSYPTYPSYGGGVSVGVVYSNGGTYYRGYQGRGDHRHDRGWHDRGQHGYYRGYRHH